MKRTIIVVVMGVLVAGFGAEAMGQAARAVRMQPSRPASTAAPAMPALDPAEVEKIKTLYDALGADEQAELVAMYSEMGVDLLALFAGEAGPAGGGGAIAPAGMKLPDAVRQKDFKRTPQTVLAARTRLGQSADERPAPEVAAPELAEWLHLHVMAGEWEVLSWFLEERAGEDADAVYAHVVQSTNQGDPMLLPEEVLALADAAPGDFEDWQLDVIAQLLRGAATRTSTGPMLAQLRAGTRRFGSGDEDRRRRTARLLARAGLPIEAYDYLPPLDEARASDDAAALFIHGQYHEGLAKTGRGVDGDAERRRAWALYAEISLLAAAPFELRQQALRSAMTLLPEVPEATAGEWLGRVFADERLAPAALEIVALDAMTLRDRNLDETERVRAIVTMKSAVQTLLDSERVDHAAIRVPLRMLTTGLVAEAEKALNEKPNRRGTPPETAMLLRAIPDSRWLETIEPSLAVRAYRAFVGVATISDETDLALETLAEGVRRHPGEAADMATEFLELWIRRLRPSEGQDQDAAIMAAMFAFGGRGAVPAAPLTRGRQSRNLDRLMTVLDLLRESGVDPRTLPNIVQAFRACHSQSEAFTDADIERVLGAIDALPATTAATLANAMGSGLAGDWRSREVQQRFGMRRNASEIAEVVEDGYALAIRLIDRALDVEPDSWSHAMTKAALAYDRLEHRRAQNAEDAAGTNELRRQSFAAFEDAAARYATAAADGTLKATPEVFLRWFNAAIGATELNQLNRDNILYEGSERDDQIERIAAAIRRMPAGLADEHLGLFAQSIAGSLNGLNPEVKPRVVRHALRVVGDHPLAAPLRRVNALYEDLIRDEIRLRLTLDGPDRVGAGAPFGVALTLRYTNAVDRETDGFAKYLQNEVWVNFGTRGTLVNYRDRLERAIESAFADAFEVDAISFFDALNPSREVREGGETGWQEKPLAYVVLRAKDRSLERLAPVQMDLDFIDSTGPVILAITSNVPAIDAASAGDARPVFDLEVTQTVDGRRLRDADGDGAVVLDVHAKGRGLVPSLDALLAGLRDALPGYRVTEDDIEAHPINVVQEDQSMSNRFMPVADEDEKDAGYVEVDADGVFRRVIERSWTVTYRPTAGARSDSFTLPTLAASVPGTLVSKHYEDLDVVLASGPTVALEGGRMSMAMLAGLVFGGLLVLVAVIVVLRRGGRAPERDAFDDLMPARATPLGAIAALQRMSRDHGASLAAERRDALAADISGLERTYFGPGASPNGDSGEDVRAILERWVGEVARRR